MALYRIFYKGRIDSNHQENHEVKEAIEEMVNFQDCKPEDIQVRKDGELLTLDFQPYTVVSVGGR